MQDLAALTLVALAAAWLTRRAWSSLTARRASGCAKGCGACPASTSSPARIDVPIIGRIQRPR